MFKILMVVKTLLYTKLKVNDITFAELFNLQKKDKYILLIITKKKK